MDREKVRIELWNLLLDAELNTQYWESIHLQYKRKDNWCRVFLTCTTGSAPIAAWGIWQDYKVAWQFISGLALVFSFLYPKLDFSYKEKESKKIAAEWLDVHNECQIKWDTINIRNASINRNEFEKLRKIINNVTKKELGLPKDVKLATKIQNKILASKGIGDQNGADE